MKKLLAKNSQIYRQSYIRQIFSNFSITEKKKTQDLLALKFDFIFTEMKNGPTSVIQSDRDRLMEQQPRLAAAGGDAR